MFANVPNTVGKPLSILQMTGKKPLSIWSKQVRNGQIKRVTDDEIGSQVLELTSSNVNMTFMTCPRDPLKVLGIRHPVIVIFMKNLRKYATLEIQVLDDRNVRRRFRISTLYSSTRVRPHWCSMPLRLEDGWNVVQFNLAEFTRRTYATRYVETTRVQIHASCRLRRIYFADHIQNDADLLDNFRLVVPDGTSMGGGSAMAASLQHLKAAVSVSA